MDSAHNDKQKMKDFIAVSQLLPVFFISAQSSPKFMSTIIINSLKFSGELLNLSPSIRFAKKVYERRIYFHAALMNYAEINKLFSLSGLFIMNSLCVLCLI
jgi:hypothetical protein